MVITDEQRRKVIELYREGVRPYSIAIRLGIRVKDVEDILASGGPMNFPRHAPREQTFQDPLLGKCRYTFFYITNDLYGGYSYECENGRGSVDYANARNVVKLAKDVGMEVHLAGQEWKLVGYRGEGEKVSPDEAMRLIDELQAKKLPVRDICKICEEPLTTLAERIRGICDKCELYA